MEETLVHQPDRFEENLKKAGLEDVQAVKAPLNEWAFCQTGESPRLNLIHQKTQRTLYFPDDLDAEQLLWLGMQDLSTCELLIVYGVGLGYSYLLLKPWLEKNPDHQLLFIEDNPEMMHAFLETNAGSLFLSDPQCTLVYKDHTTDWQTRIKPFIKNTFILKRKFISSFQRTFHQLQDTTKMELQLDILFFYAAQAEGEYIALGSDFQNNFFKNFLNIYLMKLGESLRGKFKGVPAIICGAGPSLAKQAEHLKAVKDRALIFAGGTAMNALNVLGIIPHFGAGLDPFDAQMSRILENDAFMVPYFIKPRMHAGASGALLGERLLMTHDGTYPLVKEFEARVHMKEWDNVETGANVVHFCVGLAEMMGCSPIIMVGVDLAYTEGSPYSKGVQVHATFEPSEKLISKTTHDELMLVHDIHEKPIYTLSKWIFESLWYALFQKNHPDTTLLNCTEGGIGFQGIPNASFQQLITSFESAGDLLGRVDEALAEAQEVSMPSFEEARKVEAELFTECERIMKALLEIPEQDKEAFVNEEIEKNDFLRKSIEPFYALMESGSHEDLPSFQIRKKRLPTKGDIAQAWIVNTYNQLFSSLNEELHRYLNLSKRVETELKPPKGGKSLSNIVNGVREGLQRTFFSTGSLYTEKMFQNGLEEGIHRYYYPDGTLRAEIPFERGLLNGSAKIFYTNGVLKRVVNYEKGLRNGPDQYFNEAAVLITEAHYNAGKPYGIAKVWSPSGKLEKEISYFLPGVIYRTIFYDDHGKRVVEKEQTTDFYEVLVRRSSDLQKKMNSLMLSLKASFSNHTPEENALIKALQEEMDILAKLSNELKKGAGLLAGEYQEPIWKSPQTKETLIKSIESFSQPLVQMLEEIRRKLLKLQEQKKNDPS